MQQIRNIVIVALAITMANLALADTSPEYIHEVLDNGMTVIVKHNPDSRVFAVDILGKNRAAWEKPGQEGITDFVNRMLVKGTKDKDAEQVQAALDDIGAKLTTNDSPYIPYDDRYTWRAFSFLKFETIDDYAKSGLKILYELVAEPTFPEDQVEKVKSQVMGILGMESGSTYQVCRNLYYAALFKDNPLAKPVLGTYQSVGAFNRGDLEYYHKIYYSPGNLIMVVVSNIEAKQVFKWVKKQFGKLPPYPVKADQFQIPIARKNMGITETRQPMDKEQVYIYLGTITPGLTSESASALTLAVEILSSRLQLDLREQQGLAYSVGAGIRFLKDFGWYTCTMGTGYQNFEIARDGILAEIEKLKTEPIEQAELDKARNSLWGSMLMRNMSCVNQAYNMAYYEFVGVGFDYDDGYRDRLNKITIDDVKQAAVRYFDTDNYVLAYVGKTAE